MAEADLLDPTRTPDLDTISGWFNPSDRRLFEWALARQVQLGRRGDLVELGSYLGKSAVLIGRHRQRGETFTVLDLFEGEAPDAENSGEVTRSYANLTEQAFRDNYRRFHPELPVIVKDTSDHIVEHVQPGAARFVHIDASHLYEHVATDADSARQLLAEDGMVAFDDYRSAHTPGVAAAAWEAVLAKGLHVVAVTESKLYGTWGDPAPWRAALAEWLSADEHAFWEWQTIKGERIIRCKLWMPPEAYEASPAMHAVLEAEARARDEAEARRKAEAARAPELATQTEANARPETASTTSGRSRPRRIAKDWLPPAVHRAVSRRLNP